MQEKRFILHNTKISPIRMSWRSGATSLPFFRSLWCPPSPTPPSFCTNSGRLGTSLEAKSTSTWAVAVAKGSTVAGLTAGAVAGRLFERRPDNRRHASANCRLMRSRSPRPSPTAITRGWCDATIGANATTSGSRLSTTSW